MIILALGKVGLELVESVVDLSEPGAHFEPDPLESQLDPFESELDPFEPSVDVIESRIHSVQSRNGHRDSLGDELQLAAHVLEQDFDVLLFHQGLSFFFDFTTPLGSIP